MGKQKSRAKTKQALKISGWIQIFPSEPKLQFFLLAHYLHVYNMYPNTQWTFTLSSNSDDVVIMQVSLCLLAFVEHIFMLTALLRDRLHSRWVQSLCQRRSSASVHNHSIFARNHNLFSLIFMLDFHGFTFFLVYSSS